MTRHPKLWPLTLFREDTPAIKHLIPLPESLLKGHLSPPELSYFHTLCSTPATLTAPAGALHLAKSKHR